MRNAIGQEHEATLAVASSPLSDRQERVLAFLNIGAALLSMTGSSLIVYHILRNYSLRRDSSPSETSRKRQTQQQEQPWSPYERIVFALSASDIVFSSTFIAGVFLPPSETSPRLYAVGNDQTCALLGVVSQLGVTTILYNGMLSTYYFCTVRLAMKRKVFEHRIERWMHAGIIGFAVVTAVLGLGLGKYEELGKQVDLCVPNTPTCCTPFLS